MTDQVPREAGRGGGPSGSVGVLRFEISMSLDGYVTASGVRPEEPMGDGGQVLHEWASGDLGDDVRVTVGASIAGRRTYDLSLPWWGANGPDGDRRTPTVIVTRREPDIMPAGGVYVFVGSPAEAAATAREIAGEKDIDVFSPGIGGQLLRAGLVDELRVHLVPILLGSGTRLLDDAGSHVRLELSTIKEGPGATHLRYRVLNGTSPG